MKGIDFDVRELQYIGVPVQDSTVCALRKESGISNVDQWFASKSPLKLGRLSVGNSVSDVPPVVQCALNLPLQVVDGYKGTAEGAYGRRRQGTTRPLAGPGSRCA